jgi:hypothetical protein
VRLKDVFPLVSVCFQHRLSTRFADAHYTTHTSAVDPHFVIETEPNDDITNANGPWVAPVRIEGHIYPVADVDSFKITIPADG